MAWPALLLAVAAGCGSGDGRRAAGGGELTVLVGAEFDFIDPGMSVNATTRTALTAVHRTLYHLAPATKFTPRPDLATGPPRVSEDARRVTVRMRTDARFGPPLSRRIVSDDIKYAIERLFTKPVAFPLARAAHADLVGVDAFVAGGADGIAGIETPDDATIVFRLRRPTAGTLIARLVFPDSAPVPREYARRFDRGLRSTYGAHQVPSGPYMFEASRDGTITDRGYDPGRGARLVRNPSWDPRTDERPAQLEAIRFRFGHDDADIAVRQIIRGSHLAGAGIPLPPAIARSLGRAERARVISPAPADRLTLLTLNTSIPPFDELRVRRAVATAIDAEAALRVQGGRFFGTRATHFIPPDVAGHQASARLATRAAAGAAWAEGASTWSPCAGCPRPRRSGRTSRSSASTSGCASSPTTRSWRRAERSRRRSTRACSASRSGRTRRSSSRPPSALRASRPRRPTSRSSTIRRPRPRSGAPSSSSNARDGSAPSPQSDPAGPRAVPLIWTSRPAVHSPDVRGGALVDLDYRYASLT